MFVCLVVCLFACLFCLFVCEGKGRAVCLFVSLSADRLFLFEDLIVCLLVCEGKLICEGTRKFVCEGKFVCL